jgi:hypothetical protein
METNRNAIMRALQGPKQRAGFMFERKRCRRRAVKHTRIPEVHFYEWSVSRWVTSSTRDRLDSSGRGIFRELLDLCFTQGGFPYDVRLLAVKCACTEAEFERVWPVIEKHFPKDKHDPEKRVNNVANTVRRAYFRFLDEQSRKRKGKTLKRGIRSAEESESNESADKPDSDSVKPNKKKEKNKKKEIKRKEEGDETARAADADALPEPPPPPPEPTRFVQHERGYETHDAFEAIYARHPKKGHRASAEQAFALVRGIGDPEVREAIDEVHRAWCASEGWRWKGGAKAPYLDEWLHDQGYRYRPPEPEETAEERRKSAAELAWEQA